MYWWQKIDAILSWVQGISADTSFTRTEVIKLGSKLGDVSKKLDELIGRIKSVQQTERLEMAKVDDLLAKIEGMTEVEDGIITLCGQLHQMLSDAKTDPAKLDEAMALLDTQKQKIADAVVANTDAA